MKIHDIILKPTLILLEAPRICHEALDDIERLEDAASACTSKRIAINRIVTYAENIGRHWMDCTNCHTAGVVLTHVADEILRLKLVSQALNCYYEASIRFHAQVDTRYRQNEAAAIYGLALVDYLNNDRERACHRLDKATELLKEAEQNWVSIYGDYDRADFCSRMQSEIARLEDLPDQDPLIVYVDLTTLRPGPFFRVEDGRFILGDVRPRILE